MRYLLWQNKHMPQSVLLILISLAVGIFTGVAAAAVKALIRWLSHAVMQDLDLSTPNIRFLIIPLAGILLTSIFQRYVVRGNIARGTRIIRQDLNRHFFKLSPFTIFNPLIGCSMTIGLGASAGSEGPTALSGAAIGSSVGRWFGLSDAWLRLLVGIGGGAGIAAIFKSPMGGVLFTLEVLQMEMTTVPVLGLITACIMASSTAYVLSDFTFDFYFGNTTPFDPSMLGWVTLLGIVSGLYSLYYDATKNMCTRWFTSIKNPWIAAIVTGGFMSVCIFMFPTLFGEGFQVITRLINGDTVAFTDAGLFAGRTGIHWFYISVVCILLVKGSMVSAAFSGGGVAGDFVPTLYAGALLGNLFAVVCHHLFGAELQPWFFTLAGMGAVMASTIHAPLMALFIICESTNTYEYIFPYLLAIAVSYATVKILNPKSWYAETGTDDYISLAGRRDTPALKVDFKSEDNRRQDQNGQ